MEKYQIEFKNFMKSYMEKYSPFKLMELVLVKNYNTNRPYVVKEIKIDEFSGEFRYFLESPRSYSPIPTPFKHTDLEKYTENL